MRIIIAPFIVVSLTFISSCTMPGSKPDNSKPVDYSTTQSGSSAAKYCMNNGGKVSYEKNPNVPTMEMIYCTTVNGEKIDAWKYMDIQTTQTGAMMGTGKIR